MDNLLPILIIGMVIALAVGPVMLMQPTPRQRQLAKLRAKAAGRGIIVSSAIWPQQLSAKAKYCARYIAPWQKTTGRAADCLLIRRDYQHELHVANNWEVHPKSATPPAALVSYLQGEVLPSIKAMGCGSQGVFADWTESHSVDYDTIEQAVLSIRDQIQG